MRTQTVESYAQALNQAWEDRMPMQPMSHEGGITTVAQAYAIQSCWSELRKEVGDHTVGRKIGLTSAAMQEQFGVHEPDFGSLWSSRQFVSHAGRVDIPFDIFIQPRLEGEIGFLIGKPMRGPGVTMQQVLECTEAVAIAVEVVDSRIEHWRIQILDTIADNASYGGFALGPWDRGLAREDLGQVQLMIERNGEKVMQGKGNAALGHPAEAVAWLVNTLGQFGLAITPGEIVLSGSLGRAMPIQKHDVFTLKVAGQPHLVTAFV